MQALPRQTPPSREAAATPPGASMDANHAAIALATAMNEARAALAGREEAAEEARESAFVRLQALRTKLAPLYAAIPRDVELFDLGFVTPEKPRLFVDIIAYVEPARGGGPGYRFVQEGRSGRTLLLETEDEGALIGEITRYVAQRLVMRERALEEVEELQPGPLIRQPAPLVPMTAEEAFRQWTRGTQARAEPTEGARTWIQEPRSREPKGREPQGSAPIAGSTAQPEATAAHATAEEPKRREATTDPASRTPHWPAATPEANRGGQGWWLWPTMALLIGGGLGALLIYLYAATLT